uniref:Nuclease HARBI1 n=1 Tax=Bactrocera dorsalis TaxID=27457 RepID=A0A034WLL2_BACDO
MSSAILAFLLLEEERNKKIKRKILRDHSNPLDAPGQSFISHYRLNVEPHLQPSIIPPIIQLAATLRFLAEGAYQRGVGRDSCISLARSTVSQILTKVMCLLENYICGQWVKLSMDESENMISRNHFFGK